MKKLLLMIAIIAVALGAAAQNRTAKGRVVFAGDGDPLVGASVNAGGMKVATDADGRFSITVPASVIVPMAVTLTLLSSTPYTQTWVFRLRTKNSSGQAGSWRHTASPA